MYEPHILLVEDCLPDSRLIESAIRKPFGDTVRITLADSIAQVRQELLRGPVDIVILDLNLTDSSGVSTVRAVRDLDPFVPILVLTGDDDPSLDFTTVASGANELLRKSADVITEVPLALVRLYRHHSRQRGDLRSIHTRLDAVMATLDTLTSLQRDVSKHHATLYGDDQSAGAIKRIDDLERDYGRFHAGAMRVFWAALLAGITSVVGAIIALLSGRN